MAVHLVKNFILMLFTFVVFCFCPNLRVVCVCVCRNLPYVQELPIVTSTARKEIQALVNKGAWKGEQQKVMSYASTQNNSSATWSGGTRAWFPSIYPCKIQVNPDLQGESIEMVVVWGQCHVDQALHCWARLSSGSLLILWYLCLVPGFDCGA